MRKLIGIAVLVAGLAGLACGSTGPSCGGRSGPSCASLTVSAIRDAIWNEYCLAQIANCTRADEVLQVQMGPDSASQYSGYDPATLSCSEVIITSADGSEVYRKFVVAAEDIRAEQFEIIEEVDVQSCFDLQN